MISQRLRIATTTRCLALILFPFAPIFAANPVYDFSSLSTGYLGGQDGWAAHPALPTPSLEIYPKTPGSGDMACRHSGSGGQILYRFNNAPFAFPSFSSTETNAVMFADFLVRQQGGQYNALVGVAADSTDVGSTINISAEVAPYFGLLQSTSTQGILSFVIRSAADGTFYSQPISGYASNNDWVRLKFVMNLQAGTGTLHIRNLTQLQTSYIALPNCTGVALQLSRMSPDCPPASWNALFLRMTSDLSPTEARASLAVDNIIPHDNGEVDVAISRITPPNWLKLSFDHLLPGRSYEVQSKTLDGGAWFPELTFAAALDTQTVELPITPETYAGREFRLVLLP